MQVTKKDFGEDFNWGVSTAAFQIEGAYDADGKGESIWDVFSMQKGKIYQNHHTKISCDFYNRYIQDLILMQSLSINGFTPLFNTMFTTAIYELKYLRR